MKKHEQRKSWAIDTSVVPTWPRACFEAEARADLRETIRLPYPRRSLKAGDRVSFDLGEGVDGPLYATNVRLIEPE
ncbi:MAG TPA: hypothetical protein VM621_04060 [Luteibacter sp.]|uniref:cold-shock protein n=1 Tax=Luteibacter sp. TaxID=1886636 RepID=UPI002BD351B6|nr:hypothetical protein [Luteibacter sp.]HVI54215.1 hypothetical protein [Luteibacter sp.]